MNYNSKNNIILVTGGAGYIGSVLVGQLLSAGKSVRVIDRLDFGEESLRSFINNPNFDLRVGDINDKTVLEPALQNVNAVVHLAAIVGEPACNRDKIEAVRVNQDGSLLLYDCACRQKVDRFIFASTCSNYGRAEGDKQLVTESAPLQPISTYSKTKVAFEKVLLDDKANDIKATVLRFATAFGLSYRPRFDLTVNEFSRDLVAGKKLEVYGEQFWRPYCHTSDLARACQIVLDAAAEKIDGQSFNVGSSDQNYTKSQLIDLIEKRIPGIRDQVIFVQRDNDLRDYRVSFEKINSELNFYTEKSVEYGINEIATAIESGKIKDPFDIRYQNI